MWMESEERATFPVWCWRLAGSDSQSAFSSTTHVFKSLRLSFTTSTFDFLSRMTYRDLCQAVHRSARLSQQQLY
jgi:hypothetical protein